MKTYAYMQTFQRALVAFDRDCSLEEAKNVEFYKDDMLISFDKIRAVSKLEIGSLLTYYIDGEKIVFLIEEEKCTQIDLSFESVYVCGSFNDWEKSLGNKAWALRRDVYFGKVFYVLKVDLKTVFSDEKDKVYFKFATKSHWLNPFENSPNVADDGSNNLFAKIDLGSSNVYNFWFKQKVNFNENFEFSSFQGEKIAVDKLPLLRSLFSDKAMGVSYEKGHTVFRVFAPRAKNMFVKLLTMPNAKGKYFEMTKDEDGVWEFYQKGDLSGYYYWFRKVNFDNSYIDKITDPYAKAMVSCQGPSIVVFDENLPTPAEKSPNVKLKDSVICELHIKDILKNAEGLDCNDNRGKFKTFTKYLSTQDNYLDMLGAKILEFMPCQLFDNSGTPDYHWGYMPVNYFCPHSSYLSDSYFSKNLCEFSQMIDSIHKKGFLFILDVVYNHIGDPNSLAALDSDYYFYKNPDGSFSNWSGCGNDFNANTKMGLDLICKSLKTMMLNYGVDGFRFDLAELIGVAALRKIQDYLEKINANVILISEPWSFKGHIAKALRNTSYSSWNDGFRKFCERLLLGKASFEETSYFIKGSAHYFAYKSPSQTINYFESHDDYCFLDLITTNQNNNASNPSDEDIKKIKLILALQMCSIGVPMIAEGVDLLRTKKGNFNTYLNYEINALDYSRQNKYPEFALFVRNLIKFRQSDISKVFKPERFYTNSYFHFFETNCPVIAFVINASDYNKQGRMLFVFNPTSCPQTFSLGRLNPNKWVQIFNQDYIAFPHLQTHKTSWFTKDGISQMSFAGGYEFCLFEKKS